MKKPFVFLEHMADIKFKAYGRTLNEVFENAVKAFAAYIAEDASISPVKGKLIKVQGIDQKSLLYNFLDELLYLLDAEHFAAAKAEVTLRGNNLQAVVYGDDSANYKLKHIKAATYSEMHFKKINNIWEAQVVLDV